MVGGLFRLRRLHSPSMPETYLQTAYKDRERVKGLGARWDSARKQWYVPEGRDLAPFATWLPAEQQTGLSTLESIASTELVLPTKGVSLSQLLAGVAQAVAQTYRSGEWVRVEVVKADVRRGHVYLELTERSPAGDSLAQARAMIWADTANQIVPEFERATGVVLGAGIKLLLRAKPTCSPQYGLSLVIDAIDPDYTLGDLEAKKREIRARLQREGLSELNRSLPAPWDYNAVLVVAPQGAAGLGDFQAEADRLQRWGLCCFVIVHSRFQGEGAPLTRTMSRSAPAPCWRCAMDASKPSSSSRPSATTACSSSNRRAMSCRPRWPKSRHRRGRPCTKPVRVPLSTNPASSSAACSRPAWRGTVQYRRSSRWPKQRDDRCSTHAAGLRPRCARSPGRARTRRWDAASRW